MIVLLLLVHSSLLPVVQCVVDCVRPTAVLSLDRRSESKEFVEYA